MSNTTSPWNIEVVDSTSYIGSLASVQRAAFMAYNVGPSYPRSLLNDYLNLRNVEKHWEESIADPTRVIHIAHLGKTVLGVSELSIQDPHVSNIAALYVSYPPLQAIITRALFANILEESAQSKKTNIIATIPESSHLRTFYEAQGMRKNNSATFTEAITLPNGVLLPQITLAKGLRTT